MPRGTMNFCSECGQAVVIATPDGDNRERYVCESCGTVHYQNPLVVVGCVPEYEGHILLCRRAIEPRHGYWTVPAGFMELDETTVEAAARETREEACASVEIGKMLALVDVVPARQVHVFFEAALIDGKHAAGDETLETRLFAADDIPWDDIAFTSVSIALEYWLKVRDDWDGTVHLDTVVQRMRYKP